MQENPGSMILAGERRIIISRGELSCGLVGDVGAVQEARWVHPFQGSKPGQAQQGRGSMEGVHDSDSTRKFCASFFLWQNNFSF